MDLLLNPIVLSVLVLCVLCLVKVNVLLALIFAALTAGFAGGLDIGKTMTLLTDGFSANATTALSYSSDRSDADVGWLDIKAFGLSPVNLLSCLSLHRLLISKCCTGAYCLYSAFDSSTFKFDEQNAA